MILSNHGFEVHSQVKKVPVINAPKITGKWAVGTLHAIQCRRRSIDTFEPIIIDSVPTYISFVYRWWSSYLIGSVNSMLLKCALHNFISCFKGLFLKSNALFCSEDSNLRLNGAKHETCGRTPSNCPLFV